MCIYAYAYMYVCVCVTHTHQSMYVYPQTDQPSSLPSKQQHTLLSDTHRGVSVTSFIFRAVLLRRDELLLDFVFQKFLFFGQHFLGFPKSLDCVLGCRLFSALSPTAEQLHPHRHSGINADDYSKITYNLWLKENKRQTIFLGDQSDRVTLTLIMLSSVFFFRFYARPDDVITSARYAMTPPPRVSHA